jgi:acetylornithine/succinyldiaminopimelate/putrescine aminotransferase
LAEGFTALQKKYPKYLTGFNRLGMMIGLRFTEKKYSLLFTKAAYENGMWALYANNDKHNVQILPPLIITKEQAYEIIEKTDKALSKLKIYNFAFSIKEIFNKLPF